MTGVEDMLSGGHPNSLGRTIDVVALVLNDRAALTRLIDTYNSNDPVVRLRVSNAMKRVEAERHDWMVEHIDRLLREVAVIDQPSAQWTLAQLFARLHEDMTVDQRTRAKAIVQNNLERSSDWIVLTTSLSTLADWAIHDEALRGWLRSHIDRLSKDPRKSVSGRASKIGKALYGQH